MLKKVISFTLAIILIVNLLILSVFANNSAGSVNFDELTNTNFEDYGIVQMYDFDKDKYDLQNAYIKLSEYYHTVGEMSCPSFDDFITG